MRYVLIVKYVFTSFYAVRYFFSNTRFKFGEGEKYVCVCVGYVKFGGWKWWQFLDLWTFWVTNGVTEILKFGTWGTTTCTLTILWCRPLPWRRWIYILIINFRLSSIAQAILPHRTEFLHVSWTIVDDQKNVRWHPTNSINPATGPRSYLCISSSYWIVIDAFEKNIRSNRNLENWKRIESQVMELWWF